jgi:lipid A 3-O-deacylase
MAFSMRQFCLSRPVMLAAMLAVPLAMLGMRDAGAGTGIYDMSGMINQPHPFATSRPEAPVAQRAPFVPTRRVQPSPRPAAAAPRQIASAQPVARVRTEETSFLTIGGGYYDINDSEDATELRIEWKGREAFWWIKPIVGLMATTDAAIYGYAGFGTDFYFGRRIVATPSIAVGAYRDGQGKDLGSVVEFRSALELAWRFDNDTRLGLMFYHLSNASISSNNPGTEVLSLGLSVPLN